MIGYDLGEAVEELPPGERVEAGDGLVEKQQIRSLGDRHGEGELGSLATREGTGLLTQIETELYYPALSEVAIPARVEPGAEAEVVGDRQRRVRRRVLGDEPHSPELCRARCGTLPEDGDMPRRRREQPDGEMQQGRLAGPVRPDEPDDFALGNRQGAVRERPAPLVALGEPAGLDDRGR